MNATKKLRCAFAVVIYFAGCSSSPEPTVSVSPQTTAGPVSLKEKTKEELRASEPPAPKDPVKELVAFIRQVENKGTAERVTDFIRRGEWVKRKYVGRNFKYDVRKTDSLVSPFTGHVTWVADFHRSESFKSKHEAEAAPLTVIVPAKDKDTPLWATLAFQDQAWVVTDVGWNMPEVRLERKHSTLKDLNDPVMDWWLAWGGK